MPFLDRLEMAALSGWFQSAVYEAARQLEDAGLIASVPHGTELVAPTRRFHLTGDGLRRLAWEEDLTPDRLLRSYPLAARWRRVLLERLDAVAVVYRLASAVANIEHPIRFRWYRAMPMDAAITLPDGRTIGVVRQGLATDRTGFSKRLGRLRDGPQPGGLLLVLPDETRLRYARRLLRRASTPTVLALEREAAAAATDDPIWRLSSVSAAVSLRDAIDRIDRRGALPAERPLARVSIPVDIDERGSERGVPEHMLPALLKPAEKRVLDLLSDWPWLALGDLAELLGVTNQRASQLTTALEGFGLAARVPSAERRLVLTDAGLTLLARRDRAAMGGAKRDFQKARRLLGSRAPKKVNPRRASSPYLLSGIAKCETCGKAMTAAEAKSGKYTYYICHSLLKRGKGTCETPRLNAKKFEKLIVDEIRANILTKSNIRDLVKLLDEEMDGMAREQRERLESIDGELEEVKNQLGRVWHFIARSDSVDVAEASDLIVELRERKEKLEIATEEARALLKEGRQFLDSADTIAAFAAEMSDFLKTSELTETKAFVGSFVKEVVVKPGRAAIVYSIPTPDDSPMGGANAAEIALNGRVMNSVRHGGRWRNRHRYLTMRF